MKNSVKEYLKDNYIGFEIYSCPNKPTEKGAYIGKTPIYEQAETVCKNAKLSGKLYFIKGVKSNGEKVMFL